MQIRFAALIAKCSLQVARFSHQRVACVGSTICRRYMATKSGSDDAELTKDELRQMNTMTIAINQALQAHPTKAFDLIVRTGLTLAQIDEMGIYLSSDLRKRLADREAELRREAAMAAMQRGRNRPMYGEDEGFSRKPSKNGSGVSRSASKHLTTEENALLKNEYEDVSANKLVVEYDDEVERYMNMPPAVRYAVTKSEWTQMHFGNTMLPVRLQRRIEELVRSIPKNTLRKTSQLLSATLRLRTSGFSKQLIQQQQQQNQQQSQSSEQQPAIELDDAAKEKIKQLEYMLAANLNQMNILKEMKGFQDSRRGQEMLRQARSKQMQLEEQLAQYKQPTTSDQNKSATPMSSFDFGQNPNSQSEAKQIGGRITETMGDVIPQIVYGPNEAIAYIAHRLPSIYAAMSRVFSEVTRRMPDFNPQSMLDYGTGPGTSIWAAKDTWSTINEVMAIEPSSAMMDTATKLLDGIQGIAWRRFLNEHVSRQYDVVVASYVLTEMPNDAERNRIIKHLWKLTKGVLVLVEPGTPLGFEYIREVREIILNLQRDRNADDAPVIVAPCPHSAACPMGSGQWCHFSQRLERPLFQKLLKEATMSFEDEKFSFVIFRKNQTTGLLPWKEVVKDQEKKLAAEKKKGPINEPIEAVRRELQSYTHEFASNASSYSRVVSIPLKRGGHTVLDLCTPKGTLEHRIVARSSNTNVVRVKKGVQTSAALSAGAATAAATETVTQTQSQTRNHDLYLYKHSRKVRWGDLMPDGFLLPKTNKKKQKKR